MNRRLFLSLCLAGTAAACMPESDGAVAPELGAREPIALGSQVAFVDGVAGAAFILDPADPALRARRVTIGKNPVVAVRRNGTDELLVLSRGEKAAAGVKPEPPSLALVPADPAPASRRIPLGSRYGALAQSEDGRFVVAHFTSAKPESGDLLFNPNELAVVDLEAKPEPTVRTKPIRSFGGVPLGVVFSPRLALPDGPGRLAVVLSENYVTLVDVERPTELREITIPLTLVDDRRLLRPAQVLFDAPASGDPTIFVRAEGADDVYAIRLVPIPPAERVPGGQAFRPVPSQVAAGSRPSDMALFDGPDGVRLLVVAPGSSSATVLDPRTSRATAIPLDAPASRIIRFEATSPAEIKSRPRALLVGTGTGARALSFVDLERLEEQRTRNVDTRAMGSPAGQILAFPSRAVAVVSHGEGGAAGLSIVDLANRTVSPIGAAPHRQLVVGAEADRLWLVPLHEPAIGQLDLTTGRPLGQIRLDAPVRTVVPLAPGKDGKRRVVVVHPTAGGHVTVLPADALDRAQARTAVGIFLTDLLDRGGDR